MSTTYNQCQGTNLNHSETVWREKKHSKCVATSVVKESDNIIISLSNKLNYNINHAKGAASAILAMLWPKK